MVKRSREDSISSQASSTELSVDATIRSTKYMQVVDDAERVKVMQCSLPPHEPISFSSYADYEVHYAQVHVNRCSECRKNFPTEHFLSLHIGENHDPLNDALRAKGEKTYRCFVSDCDKICSTPQKRRMHLIDKHMFPKNYDFFIVNDGLDKRTSMLRPRHTHRRRSSAATRAMQRDQQQSQRRSSLLIPEGTTDLQSSSKGPPNDIICTQSTQQSSPTSSRPNSSTQASPQLKTSVPQPFHESRPGAPLATEMDVLTSSMSALKFVPPSVRFGRGGRRGGLAKS